MTLVRELQANYGNELSQSLFFIVAPDFKGMFSAPFQWFGEQALTHVPDLRPDIRDAIECFVYEKWTATVFHSMRILERGLRELATALNVPFRENVELQEWRSVNDQTEKHIRDLEKLPKSAQKGRGVGILREGDEPLLVLQGRMAKPRISLSAQLRGF